MPSRMFLGLVVAALLASTLRADDKEIDSLKAALEKKDAEIIRLQQQLSELRSQLSNKSLELSVVQAKHDELLKKAAPAPSVVPTPEPKKLNIHAELRGKITEVSKSGLVQVSVGSDAGVREGAELELYRLAPDQPKDSLYLGQVSILKVTAKEAVGRFKPASKELKPKEGDEVAGSVGKDR